MIFVLDWVLDWKCLETSLPDMAAGAVMTVLATHVRSHQPLHPPTTEVSVFIRPRQQLKMIGHQNPGKNAPITPGGYSIQQPQPVITIPVTVGDYPPFPAARSHMIQTVLPLDT